MSVSIVSGEGVRARPSRSTMSARGVCPTDRQGSRSREEEVSISASTRLPLQPGGRPGLSLLTRRSIRVRAVQGEPG